MEVLLFAAAGTAAGAAGHRVLTSLPRGATVHIGWIVGPTAAFWSFLGWRHLHGHLPWWWLPLPLTLTWFAILLAAVDLKHRRLPNALTLLAYPALATATIVAAAHTDNWHLAASALAGGAALATMYTTIHLVAPGSLGAGDVKLSGSQGLALGAVGLPAVLVGTALAAGLTLILRALAPKAVKTVWRSGIPHGPGLLAATSLIVTLAPP